MMDLTIDESHRERLQLKMQLEEANKRIADLGAELDEAFKIIRDGKRKFAPNTTNSVADDFLAGKGGE